MKDPLIHLPLLAFLAPLARLLAESGYAMLYTFLTLDEKADLVWENTRTDEHLIWLMNGMVFRGGASPGLIGVDWQIAE